MNNTIHYNSEFVTDPIYPILFNRLPNNKILDRSKLKVFADDKINTSEKLKFVLRKVESIVGKGENASYHHFLLFPQCFQKDFLLRVVKISIVQ